MGIRTPVNLIDYPGISLVHTRERSWVRMKFPMRVSLALSAVLLTCSVFAAEELKSGPQLGKTPGIFNPLHVTGSTAGQRQCLV